MFVVHGCLFLLLLKFFYYQTTCHFLTIVREYHGIDALCKVVGADGVADGSGGAKCGCVDGAAQLVNDADCIVSAVAHIDINMGLVLSRVGVELSKNVVGIDVVDAYWRRCCAGVKRGASGIKKECKVGDGT